MFFTDEQPFLDAVSARPSDDGPRLVYAEFLDDAGDPDRAELVRVQIALARLPEEHPRRPELADRQDELLTAHSARWTEHLRDLVAGVEFRRGVPDSVSVYAGRFLSDGEELFRRLRVRRVRLLEAADVMPKLVNSPLLASVAELDLCNNELGNAGAALLARSPFLKSLESLDLAFNGLDDAGVTSLSRSSDFPNLTALSLNDNARITTAGLRELSESPFFAGLTTLDISGNDVDDAGVQVIAGGSGFPRLHTLRLKGNRIGDGGAAVLGRSPLLVRMLARSPRLDLRENEIGPAGAASLAATAALDRCTVLDLADNFLADRGFAALVESRHLSRVHTLKLGGNQITDAAIGATRTTLPAFLARLRSLDLSRNRLTRHGTSLLQAARGESAVSIDVSGNVQTSGSGEAPVKVGQVVTEVLQEVAEAAHAAELRRRIAHPRTMPGDRPHSTG